MSKLLPSRPYQVECGRHFWERVSRGDTRIPSVLATGLGKSHILVVELVMKWIEENPGKRALIIAHTDELISQLFKKMHDSAPHLPVGIVKAARNDTRARVIVSSRQTLASTKRREQLKDVGFIVIDEAHHATKGNTYGQILQHFGAFDCNVCSGIAPEIGDTNCSGCYGRRVLVAGFTATLVRSDKEKLAEVWQPGPVFSRDIGFGIRHGYLLDVKGMRVMVPGMDMAKVKKQAGDFSDSSLAEELDRSLAPEIVAKEYAGVCAGRKGIGFAPTIESAYLFAEAFNAAGIVSEVVHGDTATRPLPPAERAQILKRLAVGDTRFVWSVMALTEGFDEPTVDIAVIARQTSHVGLYQQMTGRVLRPDLTKPPADRGHALVMDVVGKLAAKGMHLASLIDLDLPDDPYPTEEYDADELPLDGMELVEREAADDPFPVEHYTGPVELVEFDPLARDSAHTWGKTAGGTYFLTAGKDALVFLVPEREPGRYGVAWVTVRPSLWLHRSCQGAEPVAATSPVCGCGGDHPGERGGWANGHRDLSMESALAWGVDVALDIGGHTAEMFGTKKKAWRKSKIVSDAQKWKLTRIGAQYQEGMTRGEVSDLIGTFEATRRIDPVVELLRAHLETEKELIEA